VPNVDAIIDTDPAKDSRWRLRSRTKKKILALQSGLAGTLCVLVLILLIGGWFIRDAVEVRDELRGDLSRAESALLTARAEFEQKDRQISELVKGRIPNLVDLEFDRLVPFVDSNIRNITFTQVRIADELFLEYRVVFHNRGDLSIDPVARVLLFDEMGIQIGVGRVPVGELLPDEVKSYTGIAEVIPYTTPLYFAIATESGLLPVG
jgi:hypothetical protein